MTADKRIENHFYIVRLPVIDLLDITPQGMVVPMRSKYSFSHPRHELPSYEKSNYDYWLQTSPLIRAP